MEGELRSEIRRLPEGVDPSPAQDPGRGWGWRHLLQVVSFSSAYVKSGSADTHRQLFAVPAYILSRYCLSDSRLYLLVLQRIWLPPGLIQRDS